MSLFYNFLSPKLYDFGDIGMCLGVGTVFSPCYHVTRMLCEYIHIALAFNYWL